MLSDYERICYNFFAQVANSKNHYYNKKIKISQLLSQVSLTSLTFHLSKQSKLILSGHHFDSSEGFHRILSPQDFHCMNFIASNSLQKFS
jgi:hypothetical protein